MFFSISTSIDKKFPNNYFINNLWVNCDNGWQKIGETFFKGYNDNFCRIVTRPDGARLEHNQHRSFPIWCQEGVITNLSPKSVKVCADDTAAINPSGKITLGKLNIDLTTVPNSLTVEQAQEKIIQLLNNKAKSVPEGIKLFCSGGVDTLLLYSILPDVELVTDEHFEPDHFTDRNQADLQKFWSYTQIHHWTKPTWLATGSHGDEYFLRGPTAIAMLTAWHNIDFAKLLANNLDCYHYHHFNKYSDLWKRAWDTRQQLKTQYPTSEALNTQILNILVNDHQHWHLGNTLTWTPFKDIEIAKILLQCPVTELIPQFLDAKFSKDLIVAYNPQIVDAVSKYKNHNSSENLHKLVEYHRSFG